MSVPTLIALAFLRVGPEEFAEASVSRYGRIIIVGNTATPDRVIMHMVGLRPGQIMKVADLRTARARIEKSGLFKTDPKPRIELLSNEFDNRFRDVLIQIGERPVNRYLFFVLDSFPDITIHLIVNFPEASAEILFLATRETLNTIRDVTRTLTSRTTDETRR